MNKLNNITTNLVVSIVGNVGEYYSNFLYGFLSLKLTALFFPCGSQIAQTCVALGSFSLGFLVRPLGGVLFGYIGDKIGVKKALLICFLLMGLASLGIGILPAYSQIGATASILMIFLRILQGLSIGGEYAGSSLILLPTAPREKLNYMGSLLCASTFASGILGAFMGYIFTLPFMPEWGWRIPFVLGALFCLKSYLMRKNFANTEAYKSKVKNTSPLWDMYENNRKAFFASIGIGAAAAIPYHILLFYGNSLFANNFGFLTTDIIFMNLLFMTSWVILLPLTGKIADRLSTEKVMATAMLGILGVGVLILIFVKEINLYGLIMLQLLLAAILPFFVGPTTALLYKIFSRSHQYSGFAIGYNLGGATLGSTAPMLITLLASFCDAPFIIGCYLIIGGLTGCYSLKIVQNLPKKQKFIDLHHQQA